MTVASGKGKGCVFFPAGDRFAVAHQNTIQIWNTAKAKQLFSLEGHTAQVQDFQYSPDENEIASLARDNTISFWNAEYGILRASIPCPDRPTCIRYSADGKLLLVGLVSGSIGIIITARAREPRGFPGLTAPPVTCEMSPDGKYIAVASQDDTLQIWSGSLEPLTGSKKGVSVSQCRFSPDGTELISVSVTDPRLRFWDPAMLTERGTLMIEPLAPGSPYLPGGVPGVASCAFSPDGKRIVVGCCDCSLRIIDAKTRTELFQITGHGAPITSCNFSPDGKRILSGSEDGTAKLFDLDLIEHSSQTLQHKGMITGFEISRDGGFVRSQSWDRKILIWDVKNAACVGAFAENDPLIHKYGPWAARKASTEFRAQAVDSAIAPDGKWTAVFGPFTNAIKLFDASGRLVRTFDGQGSTNKTAVGFLSLRGCTCCVFTRDSRRLVSASEDRTIKIWDLDSGSTFALFPTQAVVSALCLHSNGNIFAGDAAGNVYILKAE
jgi:WD40 repeat protein